MIGKRLALLGMLTIIGCSESNDELSGDQIRQVIDICREFEDPDIERRCLIDAFGSAAVTGIPD